MYLKEDECINLVHLKDRILLFSLIAHVLQQHVTTERNREIHTHNALYNAHENAFSIKRHVIRLS